MNSPNTTEILPIIGTSMGGGFYSGRIRIEGQLFSLIVSPKAEGQSGGIWIPDYKEVPGARSYNDGLANTKAMAEAGSKLAQLALAQRIGGFDDWYIPAQDELEVMYRNLKPSTDENSCYARSGINLHSAEPTLPYTTGFPVQTNAELFKLDADEAFDLAWYWSSTQHASGSDFAWGQGFGNGTQGYGYTDGQGRARFVRRLVIE